MANAPDYTVPTTGLGYNLKVRPYVAGTNNAAYTPAILVTSLTPTKRTIDGADSTTLQSVFKTKTPTLPEMQVSFTMFAAEGDPGYTLIHDSARQYPVGWLDFLLTAPNGATKQFSGWVSEWTPSEMNTSDNRTVDVTVEQQTQTVYVPPQTS